MNNYYRNTAEFYTLAKYSGNNELMHYGAPGMKWGHRKARPVATDARSIYRMKKAKAKAE